MSKIITWLFPNGESRTTISPDRGAGGPLGDDCIPDSEPDCIRVQSAPSLDITSELRTETECKPGFGAIGRETKFGNNARRTLSRAAGVFDADKIPPDQIVFLTGTIPGGTRECFDAMAAWSSYAIDLLKSHLTKLGAIAAYSLYVWEFQKRGALHLHYALRLEDENVRQKVLSNFKRVWTMVLDAVGKKAGVDMWRREDGKTWADSKDVLQADAQVVQKNVGAYLAKYLGKEAPVSAGKDRQGNRFAGPVRWWSVSRPLLSRLRELTKVKVVEFVSIYKVRKIREEIMTILTRSENPVYNYYSKFKHSQVFVTYDQANSPGIFDSISRAIGITWPADSPRELGSSADLSSADRTGACSDERSLSNFDDVISDLSNMGGNRGYYQPIIYGMD